MAEETQKKKLKAPTAQKRMIQDEKKYAQNKVFKSRIRTATRKFSDCLKEKNLDGLAKDLGNIYAIVDKAVKKNIYKINKANRVKSKYAKQARQVLTN